MATARGVLRGIARCTGLVAAALAGLGVGLLTPGGQKVIVWGVHRTVQGMLAPGYTFHYPELRLSRDGTLRLRNVRLSDPDGVDFIALQELETEVDLSGIFRREVRLTKPVIRGLHLGLGYDADGVMNLSSAFGGPSTEPVDPNAPGWGGLPITLRVEGLDLADGSFSLETTAATADQPASGVRAVAIDLRGDVVLPAGEPTIDATGVQLAGHVVLPGPAPLRATGDVRYDNGDLHLGGLQVDLLATHLRADGVLRDMAGAFDIDATIHAEPLDLPSVDTLVGIGLQGTYAGTVVGKGPLSALSLRLDLIGVGDSPGGLHLGEGSVVCIPVAHPDADDACGGPAGDDPELRWIANLRTEDLAVEHIVPSIGGPLRLNASLRASGHGTSWPEGVFVDDGHLTVGELDVWGVPLRGGEAKLSLAGGVLTVSDLDLTAIAGTARGEGTFDLQTGALDLLAAGDLDLSLLEDMGITDLRGSRGRFSAQITGRTFEPGAPISVRGQATLRPFVYGTDVRAAQASADFTVNVAHGLTDIDADLDADTLVAYGAAADHLAIPDLRVRVGDGVDVQGTASVPHLTYGEIAWVNEINGPFAVEIPANAPLHVTANLSVGAHELSTFPGTDGRIKVDLRGDDLLVTTDLRDLDRALLAVPELRFNLRTQVLDIPTATIGLTPRQMWSLTRPLHLRLTKGGVADLDVGLSSVVGSVDAIGALGTAGVLNGEVHLRNFQLDTLAELLPDTFGQEDNAISGVVTADVNAVGTADDPDITFALDGDSLYYGQTLRWLDVTGRGRLHDGQLEVDLDSAIASSAAALTTSPTDDDADEPRRGAERARPSKAARREAEPDDDDTSPPPNATDDAIADAPTEPVLPADAPEAGDPAGPRADAPYAPAPNDPQSPPATARAATGPDEPTTPTPDADGAQGLPPAQPTAAVEGARLIAVRGTLPVQGGLAALRPDRDGEVDVAIVVHPGGFDRVTTVVPGQDLPRGAISGTVTARGILRDPDLEVRTVTTLEAPGLRAPARLELALDRRAGELSTYFDVYEGLQPVLRGDGTATTKLSLVTAWIFDGAPAPDFTKATLFADELAVGVAWDDLPIAFVQRLAGTSYSVDGDLTGELRVTGSPTAPELAAKLSARGQVGGEDFQLRSALKRSGPDAYAFDFQLGDDLTDWLGGEAVVPVQLHLASGDPNQAVLTWDGPLTARVFGTGVPLSMLRAVDPSLEDAAGFFQLEGCVAGTVARPQPDVIARISRASLQYRPLGLHLREGSAFARLSTASRASALDALRQTITDDDPRHATSCEAISPADGRLAVSFGARADTAPSAVRLDTLNLGGKSELRARGTVALSDWVLENVSASVDLDNTWLSATDNRLLRASGHLEADGPWESVRFDGDVTIDQGYVDLNVADLVASRDLAVDPALVIHRPGRVAPEAIEPEGPSFFDGWVVHANVDIGRNTRAHVVMPVFEDLGAFSANVTRADIEARVGGAIDLTMRGLTPEIVGEVVVYEGQFSLLQSRFNLSDSSTITFLGRDYANPQLRIRGSMPVTGGSVDVAVSGTASNPDLKLSSDAFSSDAELFTVLLTGRAPEDLTSQQGRAAVEAVSDLFVNSVLGGLKLGSVDIDADGTVRVGIPVHRLFFVESSFSPLAPLNQNRVTVTGEFSLSEVRVRSKETGTERTVPIGLVLTGTYGDRRLWANLFWEKRF